MALAGCRTRKSVSTGQHTEKNGILDWQPTVARFYETVKIIHYSHYEEQTIHRESRM